MRARFNAWGSSKPEDFTEERFQPNIAFDIGTAPTLRRWLFAAFNNLNAEPKPAPGAIDSFLGANGTKMSADVFNMLGPLSDS